MDKLRVLLKTFSILSIPVPIGIILWSVISSIGDGWPDTIQALQVSSGSSFFGLACSVSYIYFVKKENIIFSKFFWGVLMFSNLVVLVLSSLVLLSF